MQLVNLIQVKNSIQNLHLIIKVNKIIILSYYYLLTYLLFFYILGDDYTIRVTNLPEEATESDLMELFKPFGKVNRTFLAKDKNTQVSRGFAFVNFQNKDDAQRAIWGVNDYGYNHLILKVEWAK